MWDIKGRNRERAPSKHEDLNQCCFYVGPPPTALDQHWSNIGSSPRVCWDRGEYANEDAHGLHRGGNVWLSVTRIKHDRSKPYSRLINRGRHPTSFPIFYNRVCFWVTFWIRFIKLIYKIAILYIICYNTSVKCFSDLIVNINTMIHRKVLSCIMWQGGDVIIHKK